MGTLGPVGRSAAIIVLAVSGAVAAFATIAPSADNEVLLSRTSSVETLDIPAEALLPSPESYIREERFQRGDTIAASGSVVRPSAKSPLAPMPQAISR